MLQWQQAIRQAGAGGTVEPFLLPAMGQETSQPSSRAPQCFLINEVTPEPDYAEAKDVLEVAPLWSLRVSPCSVEPTHGTCYVVAFCLLLKPIEKRDCAVCSRRPVGLSL